MAVPAVIRVRVRTVCVAGVEPVGGEVDLDTVLDGNGLPFVPKNRMSARLRDAALVVVSHAGSDESTVATALEVFGAAFESGDKRRLLSVGAAVWPVRAQAEVALALRAERERYGVAAENVLRERISAAMTVRLAQTAITPEGVPQRGSLRSLRGIRPGVVLEARLRWRRPPEARHVALLARTVLALTQIGDGQSDDLGRVGCELDDGAEATAELAFGGRA